MLGISQNLHVAQNVQVGGAESKEPTSDSSAPQPPARPSSPPPKGGKQRSSLIKMLGINYRWSSLTIDTLHTTTSSPSSKEAFRLTAYGIEGADPTEVYAGDRAPDAPVTLLAGRGENRQKDTKTRFHELFSPSKHTTFVFVPPGSSGDTDEVKERLEALEGMRLGELMDVFVVYQQSSPVPTALITSCGSVRILEDTNLHAWKGYGLDRVNGAGYTTVIVRPDSIMGAFVGDVEGVKQYGVRMFGV